MSKTNVNTILKNVTNYWDPKIVCVFNGQEPKIAKVKGEFVWHRHVNSDELFLILKGELTIHFRDHNEVLHEGEITVIPQGVEHKPEARGETHILFIDLIGTKNTGDNAE